MKKFNTYNNNEKILKDEIYLSDKEGKLAFDIDYNHDQLYECNRRDRNEENERNSQILSLLITNNEYLNNDRISYRNCWISPPEKFMKHLDFIDESGEYKEFFIPMLEFLDFILIRDFRKRYGYQNYMLHKRILQLFKCHEEEKINSEYVQALKENNMYETVKVILESYNEEDEEIKGKILSEYFEINKDDLFIVFFEGIRPSSSACLSHEDRYYYRESEKPKQAKILNYIYKYSEKIFFELVSFIIRRFYLKKNISYSFEQRFICGIRKILSDELKLNYVKILKNIDSDQSSRITNIIQ